MQPHVRATKHLRRVRRRGRLARPGARRHPDRRRAKRADAHPGDRQRHGTRSRGRHLRQGRPERAGGGGAADAAHRRTDGGRDGLRRYGRISCDFVRTCLPKCSRQSTPTVANRVYGGTWGYARPGAIIHRRHAHKFCRAVGLFTADPALSQSEHGIQQARQALPPRYGLRPSVTADRFDGFME